MFNNENDNIFRKTRRTRRTTSSRGDNALGSLGQKSSYTSLIPSTLSGGMTHDIVQNIYDGHHSSKSRTLSKYSPSRGYTHDIHVKGSNDINRSIHDTIVAEHDIISDVNASAVSIPLGDGGLYRRVESGRENGIIGGNEYRDFREPAETANMMTSSYGRNIYLDVRHAMSLPHDGDLISHPLYAPKPISTGNTEATLKYVRKVEIELMTMQEKNCEICEALWTLACEKAVMILETSEAQERQELVTEPERSAREVIGLWFHNTLGVMQRNLQLTLEKELKMTLKRCRHTSEDNQRYIEDNSFGSHYSVLPLAVSQSRESPLNQLQLSTQLQSGRFLNSETNSVTVAISEVQQQLQILASELRQLSHSLHSRDMRQGSNSQFQSSLLEINNTISECLAVVKSNERKHDEMQISLERILNVDDEYRQIQNGKGTLSNIKCEISELLDNELRKNFNANNVELESIKKEIQKIENNLTAKIPQMSVESKEMKTERSMNNLNSPNDALQPQQQANDINMLMSMTKEVLNIIKREGPRANFTNDSVRGSNIFTDAEQRSESAILRALQYRRMQDSWSQWADQSLDLFLVTKKQADHIVFDSFMSLSRGALTSEGMLPISRDIANSVGLGMSSIPKGELRTFKKEKVSSVVENAINTVQKRENVLKTLPESTTSHLRGLIPSGERMAKINNYDESIMSSPLSDETLGNIDFDDSDDSTMNSTNIHQEKSKKTNMKTSSKSKCILGHNDSLTSTSSDSSDDDNVQFSLAIKRNNIEKNRVLKKDNVITSQSPSSNAVSSSQVLVSDKSDTVLAVENIDSGLLTNVGNTKGKLENVANGTADNNNGAQKSKLKCLGDGSAALYPSVASEGVKKKKTLPMW